MNYAVAIVFYNPDERAYGNIAEYEKVFESILIVDNSTENHKVEFDNRNKVTYHHMNGNKGMAIALNYAYCWAVSSGVDYLLTMDQDTRYPEAEVNNMIEFIEDDNVKGVNDVAIYSANYKKQYLDNDVEVFDGLNIQRTDVKECNFAMTSGSFMNTKYLDKILPLDDWFIGMVDYDVCALLKTKFPNTRFVRFGNSVMYQVVGTQLKNTWVNRFFRVVHLADDRYFYMERNSRFFIEKYKANRTYVKIMRCQRTRILFNLLFEKERIKKVRSILEGKNAFLHREYGARKYRRIDSR